MDEEAQGAAPPHGRGSWLFPAEPRRLPGSRSLTMALRAAHALAAAVVTGAALLGAEPALARPWLLALALSGGAFALGEALKSGVFFLELRGALVIAKLTTAGLLGGALLGRPLLVAGLLLASVLMSHAPRQVRHRLYWGRGRFRPDTSRG